MRVRTVELRGFKRFAHFTIPDIPETVRLVVLAGPNGFGKSSLFDAFQLWSGQHGNRGWQDDRDYYDRTSWVDEAAAVQAARSVQITFHGQQPGGGSAEARKIFYLRTAHRNDPELAIGSLSKVGSSLDESRFYRMNQTDAAVTLNYQRLVSDAFDDVFEREGAATTFGDWRERVVGDLRDAMRRLFPGLVLNGLGSPLRDPTFRFTKGNIKGFVYKNLSGGEKAAFDLLLDFIVKRREFDATVFCIDEPEAHLNPRVHGALLGELLGLTPEPCQLWVATHAVGMLRRARDIEARAPGSVAFLDFESREFDSPVEMRPVRPTRAFWENALRVALDDLADLVAPREVVVCEGNPSGPVAGKNAEHDARCYTAIFGDEMPDAAFVAGGNSHDVAADRFGFAAKLPAIVRGTRVRRLIDRDDHAPADVADFARAGVDVLGRRNIEAYLYDDEVLRALCERHGRPDQTGALLAAKGEALRKSVQDRGKPHDDLKPAAPEIYAAAKRLLALAGVGNDNRAFERNVLAGLIAPTMAVYDELKLSVFPAPGVGAAP